MKHVETFALRVIIITMALLWSCGEPTELEKAEPAQDLLIPKSKIDNTIINSLKSTNEFNWNQVNDRMIWSALLHSDSIITIGYKPLQEGDISGKISAIDIHDKNWKDARKLIISDVVSTVNVKHGSELRASNLSVMEHPVLPFVEMKVTDLEVITQLRNREDVRYLEPLGYEVTFNSQPGSKITSDKGCSNEPDTGIPGSDFYVVSPNAKVSWNYSYMNIEQAWSYSTGSGVGVGLIDTGISPDQSKLNNEFNSGFSTNRNIEKYGTYVSSWWWWASPDGPDDRCGHGTAMAGTIAAPRSNSGSSVGVAYNSNLIAYRGTGDVVINGGKEKTGVSDALVALGNRNDVKVISMSIGDVFSNSKVADAVRYAHGKGKLIFAAAGTSTSFTNWYGVIFPASMNETVAVTGIKESGYSRCDICHSGSKVDFTVVMERSGTERNPLTLAMFGSQPSTVGGSSVATATAAGIAALVWAKNPGWSRDQVLNKMKQTADLYPNRDSQFGWGTLDALAAVN